MDFKSEEISDMDIVNLLAENGAEEKSKPAIEDEGAKAETEAEEKKKDEILVTLGPKTFTSSVQMFDYFFKLLHSWTVNTDINKYEYMVLLDLIKKGHLEAEKKIGNGIRSFQVRNHPEFRSRCFFIVRDDYSVDDFSFRKCVDQISPLPDNLKVKSNENRDMGNHRFGGGRGGGRGRFGRGGGGGGRGRFGRGGGGGGRGGRW